MKKALGTDIQGNGSDDAAARPQDGAAISRRTWLGAAAVAVGVGATFMMPTRASAKTAQKDAMYQEQPKGANKCETCAQFQAPNACKLVDGTISPNGWCVLYTPKG